MVYQKKILRQSIIFVVVSVAILTSWWQNSSPRPFLQTLRSPQLCLGPLPFHVFHVLSDPTQSPGFKYYPDAVDSRIHICGPGLQMGILLSTQHLHLCV